MVVAVAERSRACTVAAMASDVAILGDERMVNGCDVQSKDQA